MSIFSNETITVIRRCGACYEPQTISTKLVLCDCDMSSEENRKQVIARLRKDPAVIMVLEGKDGECKQTALLHNDVKVSVHFTYLEKDSVTLLVLKKGEKIYEITWDASSEDFVDLYEYEEHALHQICNTITRLQGSHLMPFPEEVENAECMDEADVEEDCTDEERLGDAFCVLRDHGYQTEWAHRIDAGVDEVPFLSVFENEVMMVGATHFGDSDLFIERKLLPDWDFSDGKCMRELKEYVQRSVTGIEWREYADGSFGLRSYLHDCYSDESLWSVIAGTVKELMEVLEKAQVYFAVFDTYKDMNAQRQLFIYEIIDAEIKYTNLSI